MNVRTCYAEIQWDKHKVTLLVAYAPTLIISGEIPAIRENFYESLSELINRINKGKHIIITIRDFSTKIGTGKTEYPENIGKYGNSRFNRNYAFLNIPKNMT